ncbi:MAG: universal stress protein [Chitinophagaceae bacterium]|nr:MAG: universal stress protein [Chitinophagaceae bacterium]
MKKALLFFDGLSYYENAIAFVQRLHLLSPLVVTGLFAPVVSLANLWSYAAAGEGSVTVPALLEKGEDAELRDHIDRFEQTCQSVRMPYHVHKEVNDLALPVLQHESRFADVLLLSGNTFYQEMLYGSPMQYIRDILHRVECPVLILPETSTFPTNILIAYDGNRESVYALKQFAYLFPELARLPATIIHAQKGEAGRFPDRKLVEELAGAHFKNIEWLNLTDSPKDDVRDWIEHRPDALVVTGSFSRSWLSELLRDSFSEELVRNHRLPVFIAHR